MRRKANTPEPEILEIDGIPTAAGLARRGLAHRRTDHRGQSYFVIGEEGHRVLGQAMRERATRNQKNGIIHTVNGSTTP